MLFDLAPHHHTHIHLRPPCPSIAILPLQLQVYEARLAAARQRVELSNLGGAPRSTMVWPRPGRARSDDAGGGYGSGPGGRAGQGSGVEEAVPPLLTARDARLSAEAAATASANAAATATTDAVAAAAATATAGTAAATATTAPAIDITAVEQPACVVCLEPYSAARGVVPRILVTCGHSFCEVCLDRMLEPLVLKKGRKRFPCPTCRTECAVKGGRAAALPIVYSVQGA